MDSPPAGLVGLGVGMLVAGAVALGPDGMDGGWRAALFLACAAPVGAAWVLFERLRRARRAHGQAVSAIAVRTATVNRLLEFSQTIQAAGKAEQVFACLGQFLQRDLALAGVVVVSHDGESSPPTVLRAAYPEGFVRAGASAAEMETGLCPCLRQNLPRVFRPEASPVRCTIDGLLGLPQDHPAYCVPFTVGRRVQVLVHMLLPPRPAGEWTEELKQLAQTYVNAASSALVNLHQLEEAEKQSLTDALTGLYNRRSLEQLLQREVALSERHAQPLSIVMIDMDRFKEINDSHGHAAGDHLLRAFADCVRITLRKTDLAFRYGGDEFVIALPQTPVTQAQQVVQKLRQAFSAVDFSDAIAHLSEQPTLSIGVAQRSASDNTTTCSALLAAADAALYEAKRGERNCIRVYNPPKAA